MTGAATSFVRRAWSRLSEIPDAIANEIESFFDRLWPLFRGITGEGVRRTHDILAEILPLSRIEVPSGTRVFDWEVPKEWSVREAYVVDPSGQRILDIKDNNLHLLNYSVPFRGRMSHREIDEHFYSRPDLPTAIPYVTSYYEPRWGFCLSHDQRSALPDGEYEVVVDTSLIEGALTISETVLPGDTDREVLISTYTCHPSMANNELSGPLVSAFLYRALAMRERRRFTYRFVFLPETIGSITYLHLRGRHLLDHLVGGLVLTCIGDDSSFTYKRSRQGGSAIDRACALYFCHRQPESRCVDFYPHGSDEKHYCSPGFNLPVGTMMRSPPNQFSTYHTSLDDKGFVSFAKMAEAVNVVAEILQLLEANETYVNLHPFGEPRLGTRNLISNESRVESRSQFTTTVKWLLNLADGEHDLLAMAERSGMDPFLLAEAAERCLAAELVAPATPERPCPPSPP